MSELGGKGPLLIAVIWSLAFVVFIFLLLRVYTRVVCVASYGIDDHFYLLTMLLTIAYSSVTTVAAYHGYGRQDLSAALKAESTYWRMIAQTFSIISTGTSKACVGFFLLRIVVVRWQRVSIWVIMSVMGTLGIMNAFFTWLACRPLRLSFDERIDGTCFDTKMPAIMLAMGTILVDLYFAILPWIFIWKLNMPRREKWTIASSLSLGFLAAAAGGIRVLYVKGVRDVPAEVIIWSQVETCVTLICVAIPVCRPLWSRVMSKLGVSARSVRQYERQNDQENKHSPVGNVTIGGTPLDNSGSWTGSHPKGNKKPMDSVLIATQNDGANDEVELTEVDSIDTMTEAEAKRKWALGEHMTSSSAMVQDGNIEGAISGQGKSGIITASSYTVTRSGGNGR